MQRLLHFTQHVGLTPRHGTRNVQLGSSQLYISPPPSHPKFNNCVPFQTRSHSDWTPLPPHSPHIPHLPPQSSALIMKHGSQHVPCLPLLSLSHVGPDISKQPFEQTVQHSCQHWLQFSTALTCTIKAASESGSRVLSTNLQKYLKYIESSCFKFILVLQLVF